MFSNHFETLSYLYRQEQQFTKQDLLEFKCFIATNLILVYSFYSLVSLPAKPGLLLLLFVLSIVSIGWVNSHEESGKWSCRFDSEIRVLAKFKLGLITLDGHADDWEDINGSEFSLLPALDLHAEHEYKSEKMNVKVCFSVLFKSYCFFNFLS